MNTHSKIIKHIRKQCNKSTRQQTNDRSRPCKKLKNWIIGKYKVSQIIKDIKEGIINISCKKDTEKKTRQTWNIIRVSKNNHWNLNLIWMGEKLVTAEGNSKINVKKLSRVQYKEIRMWKREGKKKKKTLRDITTGWRRSDIHLTGKGKINENDRYVIFREKTMENFPKLIKDMNSRVKGKQKTKTKTLSKADREWELESPVSNHCNKWCRQEVTSGSYNQPAKLEKQQDIYVVSKHFPTRHSKSKTVMWH